MAMTVIENCAMGLAGDPESNDVGMLFNDTDTNERYMIPCTKDKLIEFFTEGLKALGTPAPPRLEIATKMPPEGQA